MLKYILNHMTTLDFTSDLLTAEAELVMDTNIDLLANLMSAKGGLMRENAMDQIVMEIEDSDDFELEAEGAKKRLIFLICWCF